MFFVHISRILSGLPPDDHIPRVIVTHHLMRLSVEGSNDEYFTTTALDCAALHTGKDLAVSPRELPLKLFLTYQPGIPRLSHVWASLLAPLQLLATGITRYLAPGRGQDVFGLSSPIFVN